MVDQLRRILPIFLGFILILGLSLCLFPCIFSHDDCCQDSSACDTFTCQCSCSVSVVATESFLLMNDPGPADRLAQLFSSMNVDEITFEFYRPPERHSS